MLLRLTRLRELGQLPEDQAIIAEFLGKDGAFDFEPSVYHAEPRQVVQAVAEHCARSRLAAIHPRVVVDVERISQAHRLRAEQREDDESPFQYLRDAHHVILGTQAEKQLWVRDFVRAIRAGEATQVALRDLEDYALGRNGDPEWADVLPHKPWRKMVERARARLAG